MLRPEWKHAAGVVHSVETYARKTFDVYRFPLPNDVDENFSIGITTQERTGFRLSDSASMLHRNEIPDEDIVRYVDNVHMIIDTCVPEGDILYQRGQVSCTFIPF